MSARPLLCAAAALAVLAAAGCTGGDAPARPAADGGRVTDGSVRGGDVVGAAAALEDVRCAADGAGRWSLRGRIANGDREEHRYTVTASVVRSRGYTVLGARDVRVTVPGGGERGVVARHFATHRGEGLQCVTRTVRAAG
ncbi:hypothetical protein GCM10010123_12080 [Pilimelia anulata]|uniref:Secreted protein n=1 Tax=Pilimelia anulata TaxID=53371 RepID=A0A8J3F807_9ACTN|nr:hypothetical protein [Pilimelia anulata]GGJ83971.1 hypothetical protein GCM10010123_12080 [Pilimelia anulata]